MDCLVIRFFFFSGFGVAKRDVQIDAGEFPSFGRNIIKRAAEPPPQDSDSIQGKPLNGKQNKLEQKIFQKVAGLFWDCLAAIQWKL